MTYSQHFGAWLKRGDLNNIDLEQMGRVMNIAIMETRIETIKRFGRKEPRVQQQLLNYDRALKLLVNYKKPHELLEEMR